MRLAALRRYCLSLPSAAESIQWGGVYVYKVGGRMFATIGLDGKSGLSFKVSSDSFHILTREPDIVPAPYLARAGWVMLKHFDVLPANELKAYLKRAHTLIAAKLPKKTQAALGLKATARTVP